MESIEVGYLPVLTFTTENQFNYNVVVLMGCASVKVVSFELFFSGVNS